ncbi:hypothetical protein FFLO_02743 [Filobasidium floriforme]|uniref:Mitochondrial carrier n=1 Tax=Filobasidium floriforme TaxID=5210 RepID=A0A8K0NTS9_9TREE|nr:putative S-adenosylmethionine transporter [Filobasidium floriforme]KAG7561842.1 hypothetical protein FFLO_02743 [Filobasidium floriforme]KAH8083241.1 putative S-adenosylmethionine transporter [Filobasidium floriforme]
MAPSKKTDSRNPTTFSQALSASLIAGTSTDLIFYPLDTIKIRLQAKEGFWKNGGFKGVWKGVGSVVVGSGPGAAAFFTTYEYLKRTLPRNIDVLEQAPAANHLVSSMGAEIVSVVIRLPLEIIKSRTQTAAYGADTTLRKSLRMVWRNEGLKGFWRGYGGTLARDIPFTITQFPLYEYFKKVLAHRFPSEKGDGEATAVHSALAGSIGGGVASLVTQPVDVVRTRIMLEAKKSHADPLQSLQSTSLYPRIVDLYKNEGLAALFKGTGPRTGAVMVAGGIYLGLYDAAKMYNFELKR